MDVKGYSESVRRWKRVRLVGALGAMVLGAVALVSTNRTIALAHGKWEFGVTSACLEIGRNPNIDEPYANEVAKLGPVRLVTLDQWGSSFASAWRPFRARSFGMSRFLFPLWQPILVCVVGAAYAHGLIVASKCSRPGCCSGCGYDISTIPRACPECGKVDGGRKVEVA